MSDHDPIKAAAQADREAMESELGQDRQFELDGRAMHLAHGHAVLNGHHADAEVARAKAHFWTSLATLVTFTRTVGWVALILTCAYIARPFLPW